MDKITSVSKDSGKVKPSCTADGNLRQFNPFGRVQQFLKELNTDISTCWGNSTVLYIPQITESRDLDWCTNVHCSVIHKSSQVEHPMSLSTYEYICLKVVSTEIKCYSTTKEWSSDSSYHMDEPWGPWGKINKPDGEEKKKNSKSHLYVSGLNSQVNQDRK